MSTPKISFRVPTPGAGEPEATGDVVTQDLSSAPGKEREREPLYGGEIGNLSEGMAIDVPAAGECSPSIPSNFKKAEILQLPLERNGCFRRPGRTDESSQKAQIFPYLPQPYKNLPMQLRPPSPLLPRKPNDHPLLRSTVSRRPTSQPKLTHSSSRRTHPGSASPPFIPSNVGRFRSSSHLGIGARRLVSTRTIGIS